MIRRRVPRAYLVIGACCLATCREGVGPVIGPPGLRILSGSGTDTVGARLTAPIVVELRDSLGLVVQNAIVQFTGCCGALVSGDTLQFDYSPVLTAHTDPAGQARAYVQLGPTAESVFVTIHALKDTVRAGYLVRVGNLARIIFGVRDSAAYVGSGYRVRAYAGDRFGNRRPDALSYTASSSVLSVDTTGQLTALAIGRGAVVVRVGSIVDFAWVTVPPHGVVTAFDVGQGYGGSVGIVAFQLDGSDYRVLDTMAYDPYTGAWPTWSSSGQVLYTAGGYGNEHLYFVDTLGGPPRPALASSPVSKELFGSVSRNGAWFYFSSGNDLWRVRPDGEDAVDLGVDSLFANSHSRPSASSDGSRVVVLSAPLFSSTTDVSVVDPERALVTDLSVGGNPAFPRWSPGDSLILFWSGSALWVTTPTGLGTRQATPMGLEYEMGADWSPDGHWLITRHANVLELLNLETNQRLPLPYSFRFVQPSWRP